MGIIKYDLNGIIEYNEQLIQLKGRLIVSTEGTIEGRIEEMPGNKNYMVEGRVLDLFDQSSMALDLIENIEKNQSTCTSYFMTKEYSEEDRGIIPIEGDYIGIKVDNIPITILKDESLPLEDRLVTVMKGLKVDDDKYTWNTAISLKHIPE